MLRAEPYLHVPGEILRHRVSPQVPVCVHRVPGQEGGGPHLAHGLRPRPAQDLDTGRTTLSHCHTVTLAHCHTVTLAHCHTVTLAHWHTVTLSYSHIVNL